MKAGYPIRQHVLMGLQITRGRADVEPISSRGNMRKECLALLQQRREEAIFERIVFTLRNQIENAGLEHISPGIDVATRGFVRLRLIKKAKHAIIFVGLNPPKAARVFYRGEHNRGGGL